MGKFQRWLDGTLDDHTRWSWLDLWSGVLLGILLGIMGNAVNTRILLHDLEGCLLQLRP